MNRYLLLSNAPRLRWAGENMACIGPKDKITVKDAETLLIKEGDGAVTKFRYGMNEYTKETIIYANYYRETP